MFIVRVAREFVSFCIYFVNFSVCVYVDFCECVRACECTLVSVCVCVCVFVWMCRFAMSVLFI